MLNANSFREANNNEFERTFDFEKFDAYLNDYFGKGRNNLYIGLDYDYAFKDNKGLVNIGSAKNYIWNTYIQVPVKYTTQVLAYLRKCGFKIRCQGACGYNTYDVIVVSL